MVGSVLTRSVILDNARRVRARLDAAAQRSGRRAADVRLLAVTKKASPEQIVELLRSGLADCLGESRVQEALRKAAALRNVAGLPRVPWRMIGHLQTNKAREAIDLFDAVDSVDTWRLAETLQREAAAARRTVKALIQVKLTQRETQSGVAPETLDDFLSGMKRFPNLRAEGLMAIAPMTDSVEATRPHFKRMRELFDRFFPDGGVLSMGMSRDFEVAAEEGATVVRVGTALFEPSTVS